MAVLDGHVLVVAAGQPRGAAVAAQPRLAAAVRRRGAVRDRDPRGAVPAQQRLQSGGRAVDHLGRRGERRRQPAEHLERDRQIVRQVPPDRVGVAAEVAAAVAHAREPAHASELTGGGDLAQRRDARVVAPLVHDEQPPGAGGGQALGGRGVVGERLLHEHRGAEGERLGHDRRVPVDRHDHHHPVDLAEVGHGGHDTSGPALARPPDRRLRARDDRHLAAQRAQVAQDVPAPAAAADQRDDRRAHPRGREAGRSRATTPRSSSSPLTSSSTAPASSSQNPVEGLASARS
jgi:hypothetical protein